MVKQIPKDYKELQQYFLEMLDVFPVDHNLVIFLDSLDMLVPQYGVHHFRWLPQRLRENVKIILSTLPEVHGILQTLKNELIQNENNFVEMQPPSAEECLQLLKTLLQVEGRAISEQQQAMICQVLQGCSLPIRAHMLLNQVRQWTSWEHVGEESLPRSIKDHMDMTFNRLENKHGRILVSRALAYLTRVQHRAQ